MIIGTGIDAVEVKRFVGWHTKPLSSLQRIFSDEEIAYCLDNKALSAQRFAARFAAREAAYKALHALPACQNIPFLTFTKAITVRKAPLGAPILICDWNEFGITEPINITWHLSITHTDSLAIALVIAEQS